MKSLVIKGGGTTCKDAESIDNFCNIVASRWDDNINNLVVLPSAPGRIDRGSSLLDKVTDLCEMVYEDNNKLSALAEVYRRFSEIITKLDLEKEVEPYFMERYDEIRSINQASKDHNLELYPQICTPGERINSKIIAAHLKKKYALSVEFVDVFDLGLVTDGAWNDARPLPQAEKNIRAEISKHPGKIIVTPPFVAYKETTAGKKLTTLGRGGSDWSATYIGECIDASDVYIYSDKPGLLRADPGFFNLFSPEPIRFMSYREATEFAGLGASIIMERAIEPAQRARTNVYVLDSANPTESGTSIRYEPDHLGVKALATIEGYRRLIVQGAKNSTLNRPGATGEIMSLFGSNSINISGHIDHGKHADTYFYHPCEAMGVVEESLGKQGYELFVRQPLTRLTIIGDGINDKDAVKMQQILLKNEIIIRGFLSGGEMDITRTAFVAGKDGRLAARKLYDTFFKDI